ncbi:N-acetylmuramoyl-L-alanine amidase [Streptomyces sp. AJS327]|uniref:N-acetylmuramoyl-L-alanine amidase n=1 Tax=Streptomyces sp. AJS327 TaxID=2545265 RepID=UPI0015DF8C4C|nr:N-acetylmuramoyl-L-alanine amidase [Streptomyces sp. AJS327]MBA0051036.1 N-acetylmuramoyl-L-alanine amidase [Streptomyces sp. AJS327]
MSTPDSEPPVPAPARRSRRATVRAAGTALTAAALSLPLLAAAPAEPGPGGAAAPARDGLQRQFAEAAERHRVPPRLLLAVGYLQSRWDTHGGAPSVSGGYGPMHLTDARAALARSARPAPSSRGGGTETEAAPLRHGGKDGGGERVERPAPAPRAGSGPVPAELRTLERAAELTGLSAAELRTSTAANLRGGAALLADAQRRLGRPLSDDPSDWRAAVAAFPSGGRLAGAAEDAKRAGGTEDARKAEGTEGAQGSEGGEREATGAAFAREVFDVLRTGERRVTDTGQPVALPATPGARPEPEPRAGAAPPAPTTDCPADLGCVWDPAPYRTYRGKDGAEDYGNHDRTRRPRSPRIDTIVVHDVEGTYDSAVRMVKDPAYVSWHYTLRSADGRIGQHVRTRDVAWHSGNWDVNTRSIGLEHEGFLADPDAWYTETAYRTSARLVRHLAATYRIPLDRQHIIGHDNVPGATTGTIKGMHTDPGPFWDWRHYFRLLGAPFAAASGADAGRAGQLTILPDYPNHRPRYTGCGGERARCSPHGSGAVRLRVAPEPDAPLVPDTGLRPGGEPSGDGVNDTGARASTGQRFAVAGRRGEWSAVWYLGRRAWFHNPANRPTAVPARGPLVTPRPGKTSVPVYGRAYPEASAYPKGVPAQPLSPLPYRMEAGQRYAASRSEESVYLRADGFDPSAKRFTVVRGGVRYHRIQLGHRLAYVRADDVRLLDGAASSAP